MTDMLPNRRTQDLLIGRVSSLGARYFVTVCNSSRKPDLLTYVSALHSAEQSLAASLQVVTLAFTVMPDHIHWLFVLTGSLTVSQVIGRWKTESRKAAGWGALLWQENFFEHRLRDDEASESFAYYIFMNPYRARWVDVDTVWPHWRCPNPSLFPFLTACRPGPLPSPMSVAASRTMPKPWVRTP